jgi:hypothetical protein
MPEKSIQKKDKILLLKTLESKILSAQQGLPKTRCHRI